MEGPQQEVEKKELQTEGRDSEELLAEGKRCLAAGDANGAVENFQEACALMAEAHGQVARELAEPYYLYGKALLELARKENTVLGTGIPVPEEKASSGDEDDVGEEERAEAMDDEGSPSGEQNSADAPTTSGDVPTTSGDVPTTSGDVPTTSGDAPTTSGDAPTTSGDVPTTSSNAESGTSASSSDQGPSTSGAPPDTVGSSAGEGREGGKEDEEEDESDLKLAWEMLELARVICQKQEGDEYKLKLADVNLALGEVSLESDQYERAVEDMLACLQLREFVLDPTDRRLAEVHFSLGLAYSLAKRPDNAVEEYKNAKNVLEKRKEKLLQQTEGEDKEQEKCREEVKELEDILPDLDSKISDAQELKRIIEEKAKEEEESSTCIGFGTVESNSEAQPIAMKQVPVTDISHLVRKRPADEQASGDKIAKRLRTEEDLKEDEKLSEDNTSETKPNGLQTAEQ